MISPKQVHEPDNISLKPVNIPKHLKLLESKKFSVKK